MSEAHGSAAGLSSEGNDRGRRVVSNIVVELGVSRQETRDKRRLEYDGTSTLI